MRCYTVDCRRYPIPENGRMPHQNQTNVFGGMVILLYKYLKIDFSWSPRKINYCFHLLSGEFSHEGIHWYGRGLTVK